MSQHHTVDTPGDVAGTSTFVGAEPQLFVADVARACEFYGGKLGFTVSFIYGEPAFYAQVARVRMATSFCSRDVARRQLRTWRAASTRAIA